MISLLKSSSSAQRLLLPMLTRHFVNNPSIIIVNDKLFAAYKGINFDLQAGGHRNKEYAGFQVDFTDSQNYFAHVDWADELKVVRTGFLEDRHIRAHPDALNGLEDLRLFHWRGEVYALASAHTYRPSDGESGPLSKKTSMLLCRIGKQTVHPICFLPTRKRHEKNWMPWVREDELYLVYSSHPYEIMHFRDGRIAGSISPRTHPALESQFGGSTIIQLGDNFIGIVHRKSIGRIVDIGDGMPLLQYAHRAVIYGPDFEVLDVSPEFTFENQRVEFCCGIAISGGDVALSYGVWDNQAVLVKMKLDELLAQLSLQRWL